MLLTKLLADTSSETICIPPFCDKLKQIPTGTAGNGFVTNIFNTTIGKIINIFIVFTAIAMLFYLLWGAFDWVTSEGEKEKIEKARNKMTHAVIGIILSIVALTIFGFIAGDILGIVVKDPASNSWSIKFPSLLQ